MSTFDLNALEKDFKQAAVSQSFENLYFCLGFIAAVASCPDQIKPSEWFKRLITSADNQPKFENEAQVKSLTANLVAWSARCQAIFDHEATLALPPKIALTPGGKANKWLVEFSSGYLDGYEWLEPTWNKLLPKENLEGARSISVLTTILARFINEKSLKKAEPELFALLPDTAGCLKVLPNLLSAVGMLGKDLSTQRLQPKTSPRVALEPSVNKLRSIGRNDPCPCGSGKKFKKCCLH